MTSRLLIRVDCLIGVMMLLAWEWNMRSGSGDGDWTRESEAWMGKAGKVR